ncbi:MAG: bacillithiol biosynthesis BshC [Planctomycetes bacterium]|nr:bacillithiol biosynthesis BshC [Planctomycetota bacterium]
MAYRVVKLPLTTTRTSTTRGRTLVRLSRKRGKLPRSSFSAFQILARRLSRHEFRIGSDKEDGWLRWLRQAGGAKRHSDALKLLTRGDAIAVVVPLVKGVAAPRMDEVMRMFAGLELARQLRAKRIGKVVTLLWPAIDIGEWGETGISAIMQRTGELEDVGFRGGAAHKYIEGLRGTLPGTGFSSLLLDQLARAADDDPDVFKARLLLRWFDDDNLTVLKPSATAGYELNLRNLFTQLPLVAAVGSGSPVAGVPAGEPVPYPGGSATVIEGKVESWLSKFGLQPEEVLASEVHPDDAVKRHLPEDIPGVFSEVKERVLSELLRFEMGLNDLGFNPENDIKKLLTNTDIGFDKLRQRATTEAAREMDVNGKQLAKLFHYLLPDGKPQQEVMSLLHYLDFYGPDFLEGLRTKLQFDDVRHQAVYLADEDAVGG